MIRFTLWATLGLAALALTCACAGRAAEPSPSKVTSPYGAKADDVTREASTVVLVTTRDVVISVKCPAVDAADPAGVDRLVAQGIAARLPADVTLYTTPFDPLTLDSLPEVVTDDGFIGKLCTPHSFAIPPTPAPVNS
jgi:hypothetical protein